MDTRFFMPVACVLALAITPTANGAALGPGIPVKQVVPPPTVVSGVTSVTVQDFSGFNGSSVAGQIADSIQNTGRDVSGGLGNLAGDLVDSATGMASGLAANAVGGGIQGKLVGGLTDMAGGLAKDALSKDALVLDDGLRIDPWKVSSSGGDATITGKVDIDERVEDYKAKQAVRDSNGKIKKDKDGKTVYKEVPCKRRTVTADISWQLATGGETTVDESFQKKASDSKCSDEIKNLASKDALAAVAVKNIGDGVANQILPAWKQTRIPLKKDKMLKNELQLARQSEYQQALCGVRGLVAHDDTFATGMHNYGALHEALGHNDVAAEYYQKASAVDSKLKPAVKGYTRVTSRQQDIATLESAYGMKWTVGAPDYSSCPPIPEGRRMMVKKPASLMDSADGGSTIADLPKGMFVYVSDEGGGLFKVTTADGREGFVEGKSLK